MDRNKRILDEIQRQPFVQVQNALMRMDDLDLALAMYYLAAPDRALVLSYIAESKARRVNLQLGRLEQVKIRDEQVDSAISIMINRLSGTGPVSSTRKYYRPDAALRRKYRGN